MAQSDKQRLDTAHIARDRLFDHDASGIRRYAGLVVGGFSFWTLLRYELISMFVIPVPGAVGLALRRLFCPFLFRRVGRNPVFGRDVVLRNAHLITLGDNVFIDAGSLLDGRGAGPEGIQIGDDVIVHRNAVITSKGGGIRIGKGVDIGSGAALVSQSGIVIGDSVSIAGGCRVGGGLVEHASESGQDDKSHRRYSRGAVRIGDSVTMFQNAMVLDGVEIGEESIIGAAALVREDVPARTTFAPRHGALMIPHMGSVSAGEAGTANPALEKHSPQPGATGNTDAILDALLAALIDLNETRPVEKRLAVSPDTALIGGTLDSLDLVNFIASAESRLERLGIHIDLSSPTDLDPHPLRTVATLGEFVAQSSSSLG